METSVDPRYDLVMERVVDVAPESIWRGWTDPEWVKQWFTPAPYTTPECDIDLRPGGVFRTLMRGPDGDEFDGSGCYLEVVPNERLVWTSAMGPGFRPMPVDETGASFPFTAIITLTPHEGGTKYRAHLLHADEAAKQRHDGMGFHEGWGAAFDQLIALIKRQ